MGKGTLGFGAMVAAAVAFAFFTWTSVAKSANPAPDYGAGELREIDSKRLSDRLLEVTFASPNLAPPLRNTKVRILLPEDYRQSGRSYPVVYLLHGAGDRYPGWTEKEDGWPVTLEEFAADKDVVVVMPDGGIPDQPGWYGDWYNEGRFGPPEWETYHIAQLIPYVEDRFRVREDRDGRVVAGLSMGGFGAMSYAARHPDLFAGAFSFSGALNNLKLDAAISDRVWGPLATEEVRYRGHNPTNLARNLRDVRVWFRTGQGQPGGPAPKDDDPAGLALESALWPTNEDFDNALDRAEIDHTYQSYPQGGHNWWHWQRGLQRLAWPEIMEVFRTDTPARPARFVHRSTESRFNLWDWSFEADRDVVEFLYLSNVRRQGLKLRGSGAVQVVTPPIYRPGKSYDIRIISDTATIPNPRVKAIGSGRLKFVVRLGKSHRFQQFTPQQRAEAASNPNYWKIASVRISPAS